MIYEASVLVKADIDDEKLAGVKNLVTSTISDMTGKLLVNDDWGVRTLAQATEKGVTRGRFLYYLYESGPTVNKELDRRLRISDEVLRSMIVLAAKKDVQGEKLAKDYKSPVSK